jgi:hypothetical protein
LGTARVVKRIFVQETERAKKMPPETPRENAKQEITE